MTRSKSILCVALASLVTACFDSTRPTAPDDVGLSRRGHSATAVDGLPGAGTELQLASIDEQLAEIAAEVPAFAGLYLDSDGRPTLLWKTGADSVSIRQRVLAALAKRSLDPLADLLRHADVKLESATYSFAELQGWRENITAERWPEGLGAVSIDERRNRIVIRQMDGYDLSDVFARAQVPSDAYEITTFVPPKLLATLHSSFRPLRGGSKVSLKSGTWINEYCTLTYTSQYGFAVTNSHCSRRFFGWDFGFAGVQTYLHQPTTASPSVAWESFDSPSNHTIANCPPDKTCRWSESALFALTIANPVPPRIVKTTNRVTGFYSVGSLTTSGTLTISGQSTGWPVVGAVLDKIGASTGWTYGVVVDACEDILLVTEGVVLKCQIKIDNIGFSGGDSGAPVFTYVSSSQATISGILWGGVQPASDPMVPNGGIYVSPYIGIVSDLGYEAWALPP